MTPLEFTLEVPGTDDVSGADVHSATFHFHGLLSLEEGRLRLEWAGTAEIDDVTGLEVRSETLALPGEVLEVSIGDLRAAEFRGGWWRPRLELAGRSLEVLRMVPGEDRGRVRLRVARRDRQRARTLATLLATAIATPSLANTDGHAIPRRDSGT